MKIQKPLLACCIAFCLSSCTKEEITEVTEVNNFYNEYGIDIYEIEAEITPIEFDNTGGQWSFDDQIAILEIGPLDSGDYVVADLQFRLQHTSGCTENTVINAGTLLSPSPLLLPNDDGTIQLTRGLSSSERWLGGDNFTIFNRTGGEEILEDMEEAYVSQIVNCWSSNCLGATAEVQLSSMLVTVYRQNN